MNSSARKIIFLNNSLAAHSKVILCTIFGCIYHSNWQAFRTNPSAKTKRRYYGDNRRKWWRMNIIHNGALRSLRTTLWLTKNQDACVRTINRRPGHASRLNSEAYNQRSLGASSHRLWPPQQVGSKKSPPLYS